MEKLLFFGDSLTDMSHSRNKNDTSAYAYGIGYVFHIASELHLKYPHQYEVLNRGIGGNRVIDLLHRVKKDVIEEKPDVLTILIGVNEILMHVSFPAFVPITPLEKFNEQYDSLIKEIKESLPNTRIIIMEPFVLPGEGVKKHFDRFSEFYKYQDIVKELTKKHNIEYISLQKKLNDMVSTHGIEPLLFDGVHTNPAGAKLLADEWLKTFFKK